jgi:hypothetical protein
MGDRASEWIEDVIDRTLQRAASDRDDHTDPKPKPIFRDDVPS